MTGHGKWDYSVDRGGDRKKQHLNLYINQRRFPKLPLGLLIVYCTHSFPATQAVYEEIMSTEEVKFLEFLCQINA